MSKRGGGFEIKDLDKFQRWLIRNVEQGEVDKMKDRILRTHGLRLQEYLDDLTPARTAHLRNSMRMGDPNNYYKLKVGSKSYVVVGTMVHYAAHVNDGFKQEAGRFIPGEWSSGTFHYMPNHTSGMVLKGATIAGAYMFEKATQYAEEDLEKVVEFEFNRLYMDLFGG